MKSPAFFSCTFAALLAFCPPLRSAAPEFPQAGEVWRYQLLGESTYLNDCPPCERPSILQPLRGSFFLTPGTNDPMFERLDLLEVRFNVGGDGENAIQLTGSGELEIGGEVAVLHRLTLRLTLHAPGQPDEVVNFASETQLGLPDWPGLSGVLSEVNPGLFRVLNLTLDAMPIRDLWFSTRNGFTAGLPGPLMVPRSAADIFSDQGRVTITRETMVQTLQLLPMPSSLNTDALSVASGGVVQMSFDADATSSTLGLVHHGDLVALTGQRVKSEADFAAAIGPMPGTSDLGLDAIQGLADGSFLFSIREPVFSEKLGVMVGRGDLMSLNGERVRSNQDLLKAFHPLRPEADYGLDALFVWPSGEVWFSTEEPVELDGFGSLSEGDLLSDRGRVIYRNLELLRRFGPLEDVTNFGLDALTIVTDAVEAVVPPQLEVRWDAAGGAVILEWTGAGQFFQVEQAEDISGVFVPAGPIGTEQSLVLPVTGPGSFFRVRQW